jgi:NADH:ubiquinone oxidoreductase subunit F (NADH-binding)
MIGNFINASILGKIGLVVVDKNNTKVWKDAERVVEFFKGASVHKKLESIATNTMLWDYTKFMDKLEKAKERKREGNIL